MPLSYDFFARNRQSLLEKLGGGLVILSGNDLMQSSHDVAYGFRQESNFWWLTGIEEPGWTVIIEGKHGQTTLVSPTLSASRHVADGGLTVAEAKNISDADEVIAEQDFAAKLKSLSHKYKRVHVVGPHPHEKEFEFTLNPGPKRLKKQLAATFKTIEDCRQDMAELRAIKSEEEITALRSAIDLTVEAFEFAREKLSRMKYEYEVMAEFDYFFRSHNATHAYDPIVASGINACTLHHATPKGELRSGDLMVIDIGARVDGYAADLARTWSIGESSPRAQALHAAVVEAQAKVIAMIKPGLTVEQYIVGVDEIMHDAMRSLDLDVEGIDMYRRYFPHAISHGLGVDVHDSLGGAHALAAGMVIMVEPGIYIKEEGIGARVEDAILVTDQGTINLSEKLSIAY